MSRNDYLQLSKRERQIMDIVYRLGRATANEIMENLSDPPTHHAIRALIRILESKGHLKHKKNGVQHVYFPTRAKATIRRSALKNLVETFYGGSIEETISALISDADTQLSEDELERLSCLIQQEKEEGKQ